MPYAAQRRPLVSVFTPIGCEGVGSGALPAARWPDILTLPGCPAARLEAQTQAHADGRRVGSADAGLVGNLPQDL